MNPVYFSGAEVIDMAVKIEENGYAYYSQAVKAAKTKELKALFKTLANEEHEHIKVFAGFRKLLRQENAPGFTAYNEEAAGYLSALADTRVFTFVGEGARLAKAIKSEKQAVNTAIGMEKDSLLFYYELGGMMRGRDRLILENLIEQEKAHLRKLTALLMDVYS